MNELQQRFQALEELPTNPELVERLKGKISDPLTDVWQIINITKRLDASEQGIDKVQRQCFVICIALRFLLSCFRNTQDVSII